MRYSFRLLASTLVSITLVSPALAQDAEEFQVKPCNIFCKIWRNVSGNAQVSFASPIPSEVRHDERALAPEEGAGDPKTAEIAAVPGVIIVPTAAERRAQQKQRAAMIKETIKD